MYLSGIMAYNQKLADRVREALENVDKVEEKEMFRGLTFMVDGKMCISVSGDELMCRVDPTRSEEFLERPGTRPMMMKDKQLDGYLYVDDSGYTRPADFKFWVDECLSFNPKAKRSKK